MTQEGLKLFRIKGEFNPEDFYADEEVVITLSHMGYIKRTSLSRISYSESRWVGSRGSDTRDEDFLEYMYSATMHNYLLFFTEKGRVYWLKVYDIPKDQKRRKAGQYRI